MPRGEPTRAQISNGLEYVAQKPAFLQNFGRAMGAPGSQDGGGRRGEGSGRAALPSDREDRWRDGEEGGRGGEDDDDDDDDEWEAMYGGGEGPQVVVLKEGRHLNADELARERRRAQGLPSPSPPSPTPREGNKDGGDRQSALASGVAPSDGAKAKAAVRPPPAGHKRKLFGEAAQAAAAKDKDKDKDGKGSKPKKKKKAAKGPLSFDEAEGEA